MKKPLFVLFASICFLVSVTYGAQGQPPAAPALSRGNIKLVVDSVSNVLARCYVFPDKAKLMSARLKEQLKKGAYAKLSDPVALAQQLHSDLQKVNPDSHLAVLYDPWFEKAEADRKQQKDLFAEQELAALRKDNFLFQRVEILPGNIGYFSFTGFNPRIPESKPVLNAAFTFLQNTQAVIIDLRENHGGSPEMVKQIESYFFREKTHMMDIVDRVDNKTYQMWADPANTDSITLSVPVYILTSKGTFSGAEDFSYGMQSVKRAVVVGETTGGGAHPTRPFSAGQGFVVAVPFARSLNPYTKTDWEGTGVKPDFNVPASEALVKAQELIFTGLLSKATDDQEKRKIQWMLYKLKADNNREIIPAEILSEYTGVYQGGLDFYAKDGQLFCKNAERGNMIFPLKKVSGNFFVLDENVIVEFTKDTTGKYSQINMLWKDGWVSQKPKVQ